MPTLQIIEGDITTVSVDAIVNAANSSLLGGGGVDGAIHRAGGPAILRECRDIRSTTLPNGLPTGQAIATTAGDLNARRVIHTVGPVYDPSHDRSALLRACYANSLAVADEIGAESVAFPLISAGVYGWPLEDAVCQAVDTVRSTPTRVREVVFVAFSKKIADLLEREVGRSPDARH